MSKKVDSYYTEEDLEMINLLNQAYDELLKEKKDVKYQLELNKLANDLINLFENEE